jgi:cytochrome bd-type quinol oxidase subunit 2
MDNSKTLAALIGPTLAALGAMLLLNQPALVTLVNDPNEGPMIVMISGILVFVAGLAIVRVHNRRVKGWSVIITIVGWLGIISGLGRMWFPVLILNIASHFIGLSYALPAAGIFMLAVGGFLSLKAYSR